MPSVPVTMCMNAEPENSNDNTYTNSAFQQKTNEGEFNSFYLSCAKKLNQDVISEIVESNSDKILKLNSDDSEENCRKLYVAEADFHSFVND